MIRVLPYQMRQNIGDPCITNLKSDELVQRCVECGIKLRK